MATELHFDCGTLVAPTLPDDARLRALFQKDARTGVYRTEAWRYREVVLRLRELGEPYEDRAKRFEPLPLALTVGVALALAGAEAGVRDAMRSAGWAGA